MPARAPASMDMLQIVMRPAMSSARMASPAYSSTLPVPPAVPISRIRRRMKSLAPTHLPGRPENVARIARLRRCHSVCVASTCSTSLVPMPNASAPNAPCVAVWESPQTIVSPGRVRPSSGAMMCTMPVEGSPMPNSCRPNSAQFFLSASICACAIRSMMFWGSTVGTLWSMVATFSLGRRTWRPASRSPSNACGLVTSWTSWRSTYSSAEPFASSRTTCRDQTLS